MRRALALAVLAALGAGQCLGGAGGSERPVPRPLTLAAASASQFPAKYPEMRPEPRPEPGPELRSVAASFVVPPAPLGLAAAGAPIRPAARPANSAEVMSLVVNQVAAIAPLPARRPAPRPDGAEVVPAAAVMSQPQGVTGRNGALCGDPALVGKTVPTIIGRVAGCGLAGGVKVSSVDGVALTQPVTVDCQTALSLRAWVTEGLKPSVGARGGGVKAIEVLGSYDCRPVNNRRGNRISEHGRGKAVDIGGFILNDGEVIRVEWHWGRGRQGKILQAAQWTACRSFGTVLGPGANGYHRDHFHFDTAKKVESYCR
ncbi:MAG: extensin family protein [Paracoccaceae bacterium]